MAGAPPVDTERRRQRCSCQGCTEKTRMRDGETTSKEVHAYECVCVCAQQPVLIFRSTRARVRYSVAVYGWSRCIPKRCSSRRNGNIPQPSPPPARAILAEDV